MKNIKQWIAYHSDAICFWFAIFMMVIAGSFE